MEFTLAQLYLFNRNDGTEGVQSKQISQMYTAADRLTRDTYVVNYKWHCHQIKLNQGYDTSCCPTDWSGWRALLAAFGNE